MQLLRIDHVTEYRFDTTVTLLPHRLLIRPRESHNLRIASSVLDIQPAHEVRWLRDVLDNSIALVRFRDATDLLRITSVVVVEHYDESPLGFVIEPRALTSPFEYHADDAHLLSPFRAPSWPDERAAVQRWLRELRLGDGTMETFALLQQLNVAIHDRVRQRAREEEGVWPPGHTLSRASGACRDLAALFIDACRCLGFASRFVSGYLHAPVSELGDGSTHAWAEVYLPGPGWTGFDPSSGEVVGSRHIPVAVSSHPQHVPPVSGSFQSRTSMRPSMRVQVRVQPHLAS
jgi:transglutaminase-like putative cysteine protease